MKRKRENRSKIKSTNNSMFKEEFFQTDVKFKQSIDTLPCLGSYMRKIVSKKIKTEPNLPIEIWDIIFNMTRPERVRTVPFYANRKEVKYRIVYNNLNMKTSVWFCYDIHGVMRFRMDRDNDEFLMEIPTSVRLKRLAPVRKNCHVCKKKKYNNNFIYSSYKHQKNINVTKQAWREVIIMTLSICFILAVIYHKVLYENVLVVPYK